MIYQLRQMGARETDSFLFLNKNKYDSSRVAPG